MNEHRLLFWRTEQAASALTAIRNTFLLENLALSSSRSWSVHFKLHRFLPSSQMVEEDEASQFATTILMGRELGDEGKTYVDIQGKLYILDGELEPLLAKLHPTQNHPRQLAAAEGYTVREEGWEVRFGSLSLGDTAIGAFVLFVSTQNGGVDLQELAEQIFPPKDFTEMNTLRTGLADNAVIALIPLVRLLA